MTANTLEVSISPDVMKWVINSKDSLAARRFTLMHEYGHILLKKGGLCVPQTPSKSTASTIQGVEAWCNRFAAFVLMPEVEFRK